MPATLTPVEVTRTCRGWRMTPGVEVNCGRTLPATEEFFYVAPGRGSMWYGCRDCVRAAQAEARRVRRLAGTTASARTIRRAATEAPENTVATRTFGVEIEFTQASQIQVKNAVRAAGLPVHHGYSASGDAWKVTSDGTMGVTGELVSPILSGAEGVRQVEVACEALRTAGARVARCCGLHVHHGAGDLSLADWKALYRNWADSQQAINGLVSPSRRTNHFCQALDYRAVERMNSLRSLDRYSVGRVGGTRYRALNVSSYPTHGTVEVRLHQGTTDARKILAWTEFGQAMIEAARRGARISATQPAALLDALVADGGLSSDTRNYLARRAARLARERVR